MREWLLAPQGRLRLFEDWLAPSEAQSLLAALPNELHWHEPRVRLFGREHVARRLQAWVGDVGADYRYSGVTLTPQAWTPALVRLRERLSDEFGLRFNSVLLNHYRCGEEGMGWHSDDEPSLGRNPCIASLSLGAMRDFCLKPRPGVSGERVCLPLPQGSLLLMEGDMQHHWMHAVPPRRRVRDERFNLTFRLIRGVHGT